MQAAKRARPQADAAPGGPRRPLVLIINDHDRNDDCDSVDPIIRSTLDEHVELVSLSRATELAPATPVEAVLTLCHAKLDGALLDLLGGAVRVVSNYGVGVDHVDLDACTVRSIVVGHTPGVLTEATADMGWALLMAAARRIPEADKFARGSGYTRYQNMIYLGRAVAGTTIGIIGMGRIGTAVAKRATGFSMKILYHNRSRSEAGERDFGAEFCSLDDLLTRSDYVVLVCPSTPETRHIINAQALKKMKKSAILVNIARGPVVDTDALVAALQTGEIDSAALDVFDPEPLPRSHALLKMSNCIMAPHRGSATIEARAGMAQLCIENLLKGLAGEKLTASPEC